MLSEIRPTDASPQIAAIYSDIGAVSGFLATAHLWFRSGGHGRVLVLRSARQNSQWADWPA